MICDDSPRIVIRYSSLAKKAIDAEKKDAENERVEKPVRVPMKAERPNKKMKKDKRPKKRKK